MSAIIGREIDEEYRAEREAEAEYQQRLQADAQNAARWEEESIAAGRFITRRSRIGMGWTNTPVQVVGPGGSTRLTLRAVQSAGTTGTARTILEELAELRKLNSGNDWGYVIFVNGRRTTMRDRDLAELVNKYADQLPYNWA